MPTGRVEINPLGPHPFINAHTHDVPRSEFPVNMGDRIFEATLNALEDQFGDPPGDGGWFLHIRPGVQFATAEWTADGNMVGELDVAVDEKDPEWYSLVPLYETVDDTLEYVG